nr:Chain P, upain-2-4-W3A peptide [Phage display vector pTDisp]
GACSARGLENHAAC